MFYKGMKRPEGAGRKKGQIARNSLSVRDLLDARGINIIHEILDNISDIEDPIEKAKLWLKLAEYAFPKQRATEITGEVNVNHNQPLVQITLPSNGRELNAQQIEVVKSLPSDTKIDGQEIALEAELVTHESSECDRDKK